MKVKGPAVFECELDFYHPRRGRGDAAALDGLHQGLPDVGAEEGSGDVGVMEVEDRGGEGSELVRRLVWEVDEAAVGEVEDAG